MTSAPSDLNRELLLELEQAVGSARSRERRALYFAAAWALLVVVLAAFLYHRAQFYNRTIGNLQQTMGDSEQRIGEFRRTIDGLEETIRELKAEGEVLRKNALDQEADINRLLAKAGLAVAMNESAALELSASGELPPVVQEILQGSNLTAVPVGPSAQQAYQAGIVHFWKQNYDSAIESLTRALQANPLSATTYAARGTARVRSARALDARDEREARLNEALADLDAAILLDGSLGIAWAERGAARLMLGEPARALADLDQALQCSGNPGHALALRGKALLRLHRLSEAIADLEAATTLLRSPERARADLALARFKQGDYQAALAEAEATLGSEPRPIVSQEVRGACRVMLGRYDEALDDLEGLKDRFDRDEHKWVWGYLGQAYAKLGRSADARVAFAKARAAETDDATVLGWLKEHEGDATEAPRTGPAAPEP